MTVKLVDFKNISEQEYINYIEEWEQTGESIVPSATKRRNLSYNNLVIKWLYDQTDEVYKDGFVPSTLYFLVNEKERILGAIHLRHELNEQLLHHGGHIGYGVRPSERQKGYASLMLRLLLDRIKDEGFTKVLLTCDDDNISSYLTIEANGGILFDKVEYEGKLSRRYWIFL